MAYDRGIATSCLDAPPNTHNTYTHLTRTQSLNYHSHQATSAHIIRARSDVAWWGYKKKATVIL